MTSSLPRESEINNNIGYQSNKKISKSKDDIDIISGLGNAIPDRFANPGISGLSLLNPGIPGLNRARLWLAIAGLLIAK